MDRAFWKTIEQFNERQSLTDRVQYLGEVDAAGKAALTKTSAPDRLRS